MTRILSAMTWLAMGCIAAGRSPADESMEPPLRYTVTMGDRSLTIVDGEPAQLEGAYTNPRVMVKAQPTRVFPYQGLQFRYPSSFTFDADLEDASAKSWTLSGNDFKIMLFRLEVRLTVAEYASGMMGRFGEKNAKIANKSASITLGKEELSGTTLHVQLAGTRMVMDIYGLPSAGETTMLLVFQDTLDERGQRTKEGRQTLEEMRASFALEW